MSKIIAIEGDHNVPPLIFQDKDEFFDWLSLNDYYPILDQPELPTLEETWIELKKYKSVYLFLENNFNQDWLYKVWLV